MTRTRRLISLLLPLAALGAITVPALALSPPQAVVWGSWFSQATDYHDATPTDVNGIPGTVTAVATSNSDAYFLTSDGQVYALGAGQNGELGDGQLVDDWAGPPVQVKFPAGVTIAFLSQDAMPYDGAIAVDTTGTAWFWGNGTMTDCMRGTSPVATPVAVPLPDVTQVAAASWHALYVSSGTLYSCGLYQYGSTGTGKAGNCLPCKVTLPADSAVTQVVASCVDSGALLSTGAYYNWGSNGQDQLGDGSSGGQSAVPVQVSLPDAVTYVSQGGDNNHNGSTIVQLANGSWMTWGDDQSYELGNGKTANEPNPIPITMPSGTTTAVEGGLDVYAMTSSGVYTVGAGTADQLGTGAKMAKTFVLSWSGAPAGISSTANSVAVQVG